MHCLQKLNICTRCHILKENMKKDGGNAIWQNVLFYNNFQNFLLGSKQGVNSFCWLSKIPCYSLLTEKYEQSTTSYFFDENSSLTKYITLPMILKGRCSLFLQICNFKFIAEITHYLFFLNIIIFACFFICSILKTTSC